MTSKEKAAYIKGLAEGLALDESKPETKIILQLIDLVGEMADELECNADDIDSLGELMDEIDEDLAGVEDIVYGIDEDDEDLDDEDDDFSCDGNCDGCDGCDDMNPEEDMRCVLCPHCGEQVFFDDTIELDDLTCPACGKPINGKE